MKPLLIVLALLCLAFAPSAQTEPALDSLSDSVGTAAPDSAGIDSTETIPTETVSTETDSTAAALAATIEDSIRIVFPEIDVDTLSETQRMLAEHEARILLKRRDEVPVVVGEELSVFDSLVTYYLDPRWNLREDIDRSFMHDAGDYFKTAPGYFVLEPQMTPLRKTVEPYGLTGDRMAVLSGGRPLKPFDHVIEPDGMIDFNDIPTALDHEVAVLPGPVGRIFGGGHAVATLLTLPERPEDKEPLSAFIVDKGGGGFSYARGRYYKLFSNGREINMSIGYRNSGGQLYTSDDDTYHYTAEALFPLGPNWQLRTEGRVFKRSADFVVRPSTSVTSFERDRFDRDADLSISRHNSERTSRFDFGYRHLRQGSAITGHYHSNLNQTGHTMYVGRDWLSGRTAFSAELSADYLKYDDWQERFERYSGTARLTMARLSSPWGWALSLEDTYDEDYKSLPSASLLLKRGGEHGYLMASVGYSERAPSLNELHLPFQKAAVYGSGTVYDYADAGNPGLASEKQLIGSVELALGGVENNLVLSATGGQLYDGIDWRTKDSAGLTVFTPANGDVTFIGAQANARWRLWRMFAFKAGGAYNYTDYDLYDKRPYSPEYQAFGGGELHVFWSQKLIDLWAYGEVAYIGRYNGYVEKDLGDRVVVNTKLSFKMGNFRFHWAIQNSLLRYFSARDDFRVTERYTSYGFTWEFFD